MPCRLVTFLIGSLALVSPCFWSRTSVWLGTGSLASRSHLEGLFFNLVDIFNCGPRKAGQCPSRWSERWAHAGGLENPNAFWCFSVGKYVLSNPIQVQLRQVGLYVLNIGGEHFAVDHSFIGLCSITLLSNTHRIDQRILAWLFCSKRAHKWSDDLCGVTCAKPSPSVKCCFWTQSQACSLWSGPFETINPARVERLLMLSTTPLSVVDRPFERNLCSLLKLIWPVNINFSTDQSY